MNKGKLKKVFFPRGFKGIGLHCGLKAKDEKDLAVIYSEKEAVASAVFTKNHICGAPIVVGREVIKKNKLQACVINSKISNVATGQSGIDVVYATMNKLGEELGIDGEKILVSSTGLIGAELPFEKINKGLDGVMSKLSDDPLPVAQAIMTTDTYPKVLSKKIGGVKLTLIAKGSGMVAPNMATMLVYIMTDAQLSSFQVDSLLYKIVEESFNMLSVDGDTSTSDTVVLMANGLGGEIDEEVFYNSLRSLCVDMTKILARDGEGATKLIQVDVDGALDDEDAKIFAKSVVNSPLVKTMCYGGDPNIGRIFMALGKCVESKFAEEKVKICINECLVALHGKVFDFNEEMIREELQKDTVVISIGLLLGSGSATAYGCDLTEGYIRENASYFSS